MYNLAKESQYKLQAEIAVILNEYISILSLTNLTASNITRFYIICLVPNKPM